MSELHIIHSKGSARLHHPAGPTPCSWGGLGFEPDEDGVVTVPIEAIDDLKSHGFVAAPPKVEPEIVPLKRK